MVHNHQLHWIVVHRYSSCSGRWCLLISTCIACNCRCSWFFVCTFRRVTPDNVVVFISYSGRRVALFNLSTFFKYGIPFTYIISTLFSRENNEFVQLHANTFFPLHLIHPQTSCLSVLLSCLGNVQPYR